MRWIHFPKKTGQLTSRHLLTDRWAQPISASVQTRHRRQKTKHVACCFRKLQWNALGLCWSNCELELTWCNIDIVYFACRNGRSCLSPGESQFSRPWNLVLSCRRTVQFQEMSFWLKSRQQTDSSAHLGKLSRQHYGSWNSQFDLHGPKALHCCFPKRHGHVFYLLSKEACLFAGTHWINSSVSQRVAKGHFFAMWR